MSRDPKVGLGAMFPVERTQIESSAQGLPACPQAQTLLSQDKTGKHLEVSRHGSLDEAPGTPEDVPGQKSRQGPPT